jgi:hypothetical protein
MRKITTIILVLIASISFAQRVSIVSPPFLIKSGTQYAALGSQKSFFAGNAKRWYYYKSDSLGSVTKLKWKLTDYIATDSSTAVSSLPDGFLVYDLPCSLYDYQQVATWTPEATEYIFRIRIFDGLAWMTQDVDANTFVVRGKNVLTSLTNVVITDSTAIDSVCYASIQGELTGTNGLAPPIFPIPSGYSQILINGTIAYTSAAPTSYYAYTAYGSYDTDGAFAAVTIASEASFTAWSSSSSINIGSNAFSDVGLTTALLDKYYGITNGLGYQQIHITSGIVDDIKTVVFGDYALLLETNLMVDQLPSKNYINWDDFPDITIGGNIWVGYGQFPQFSHDLAGASMLTGLPAEIRKGFKNVGSILGYANTPKAVKYTEAISAIPYGQQIDNQGYAEGVGIDYVQGTVAIDRWEGSAFLWDNEHPSSIYEYFFNTYAAKGGIDYAIEHGNSDFKWIDYHGIDLPYHTRFSNYYFLDGNGQQNLLQWPAFKKDSLENYRTVNSSILFDSLRYVGHNYQRTIQLYPPAPLPNDVSLYQKSGADFVLDPWGDRLPILTDISATLRGIPFTLRTVGDRVDSTGLLSLCSNEYGVGFLQGGSCINKGGEEIDQYARHQSWMALNGLSAQVALLTHHLIARNKEQFGDPSIVEYRDEATWDYLPLMSFKTETRPWGQTSWQGLPVSRYQTNTIFFSSMITFGRVQMWNGQGEKEAHPMGQDFPTTDVYNSGTESSVPYDMGQISNITAGIQYCEWLHDTYSLFSNDDKILVFMEPSNVQDGEIIALGRMNGDNVFLILAEPRLDIGETMLVEIRNGVDLLQTVTVTARELKRVIFTLPTGTHAASDIHISYVPLKEKDDGGSTAFNLTGDLIGEHVYIP